MICDEPSSTLDPLVAADILKLLAELQRDRGVSYIFISHDIATVRSFAREVAILHRGAS